MSWLDRAIKNIPQVLEREAVAKLVLLMNAAAPLKGSSAVFRRMAQATSAETILDYLAEIRFGLTFRGLRFEVEFEPRGRRGPDFAVFRDRHSTYVEVKRFRPSVEHDGPAAGVVGGVSVIGNVFGPMLGTTLYQLLPIGPYLLNGAIMMVARRSRRFSMVRVDMIAGTAQAEAESSGINDFPCNPNFAMVRSAMRAARAR